MWAGRTPAPIPFVERIGIVGFFVLGMAGTWTISAPNPLFRWGYCLAALGLAGLLLLSKGVLGWDARRAKAQTRFVAEIAWARGATVLALGAIAGWGFVQIFCGGSEYVYATRNRTVDLAAMAAVAVGVRLCASAGRVRTEFLRAFAVFGFVTSVVAVLAYFTSPGKILWVFASPYPDTWGPFLSRNDFAIFLELSFPVALWIGLGRDWHGNAARLARSSQTSAAEPPCLWPYLSMSAWMYAAGVASASRAGSALLTLEAVVILWTAARRIRLQFAVVAAALVAIAGAGTLAGRIHAPDSFAYRREIVASTLEMIGERPWLGFGLGTFPRIYPGYARFDAGAEVNHAHNDWLEWAAEGGIPFALVWMVLAASIAPAAVRCGWGVGLAAVFLHALVDYPFAKPGLAAWTFALIGTLDADEMRKVRGRIH